LNGDVDKALMHPLSTHAGVGDRPVIYAGRFIDRVAEVDLPEHYSIRSERDVHSRFSAAIDEATTLIILDLRSFPLQAMTRDRWDVPLVVVLPSGSDADSLTATFGSALFERLGFFDRIVTPDSDVWEGLRRGYCWAENQRISIETDDPGEAAVNLCTLFAAESTALTPSGDDRCQAAQYRKESGGAPADPVPYRKVCSFHRDPRSNKAVHRMQAEVLRPRFIAARGERADDVPLEVLEVGTGGGRWATSFDLAKTRFTGVDIRKDMIRAARSNFPELRFDQLGPDLLLPYNDESFDLVFGVAVMQDNPLPVRRTLLSEMWRVGRPGGRLLFMEDFVSAERTERPSISPMSVLEFVGLILEVTAGQVVLEHVESLRYPHDDLIRGGVISLLRLGVPKRDDHTRL
jgi:SAM-dependent methyltransferase